MAPQTYNLHTFASSESGYCQALRPRRGETTPRRGKVLSGFLPDRLPPALFWAIIAFRVIGLVYQTNQQQHRKLIAQNSAGRLGPLYMPSQLNYRKKNFQCQIDVKLR
jgi:hypothetical protein